MVEYTEISEDAWQQLAPVQQPDPWEPLMSDLSKGKIVSLPYSDPKERRVKRLSIARRATNWGFKTEARYTDSYLAIRRADLQSVAPAPAEKPKRGRRKEKETVAE